MLPITTKKAGSPPRIVVYGPPGCGKTTLAANAVDSLGGLIIDTDGGSEELADGIARISSEHMRDWESFMAIMEEAAVTEGGCLVLDTLDEAQSLAATHVCNRDFGGDWGRKGFGNFGQGWAGTIEEMKRLEHHLDRARNSGKVVIIVAHESPQRVYNPLGEDYDKWAPSVAKGVWGRFSAWADIIGHIELEHTIVDDGRKTKARGTGRRIIRFAGSAAEDAKARAGFELPDTLPLSWLAMSDALRGSQAAVEGLMTLFPRFDEEQQEKALAYLGISNISEAGKAPMNKIASVLNRLRTME